jgi:serine/threonine protein kinase
VSVEAKDFVSKILVADPAKRLNCDQMKNHPWMKMDLAQKNLTGARTKLSKYVSVRKEQSQRMKKDKDEDDD